MSVPERIPLAIVDDDEMVRTCFSDWLESTGRYAVVIRARDGEDYIAQSRECVVRVALVNLRMPRMDGWVLIGWMREHQPQVPAGVLDRSMDLTDRVRALRVGAKAFLQKGMTLAALLRGVDDLVERRFHMNELMDGSLVALKQVPEKGREAERPTLREAFVDPAGRMAAGLKVLQALAPRTLQVFRWRLHSPQLDNDQIGRRMKLCRSTVDSHCKEIARLIHLRDRAEAMRFCSEHGLLELLDPVKGLPIDAYPLKA